MKGDQSPLLQVMSSFHLGIKFQSQPRLKAGQGKKKKAISKKKNKKKQQKNTGSFCGHATPTQPIPNLKQTAPYPMLYIPV
jgi:hypothetical protein